MQRVVKLSRQWSSLEIAVLTEMVTRGDLLAEAADTLDRSITELEHKIMDLRLKTASPERLYIRAA